MSSIFSHEKYRGHLPRFFCFSSPCPRSRRPAPPAPALGDPLPATLAARRGRGGVAPHWAHGGAPLHPHTPTGGRGWGQNNHPPATLAARRGRGGAEHWAHRRAPLRYPFSCVVGRGARGWGAKQPSPGDPRGSHRARGSRTLGAPPCAPTVPFLPRSGTRG
jgi:hypothetical protein